MNDNAAIQVDIRRLREGDEALAVDAVRDLKEPGRNGQTSSPGHMRRLLVKDENYFYVVTEGDRPVGFMVAHRFPRIDRDSNMIYLYEIGVHPDYRRKGIGTVMINVLKQDCQNRNIMKVWVGTERDNTAARSLFESTGAKLQSEEFVEYVYEF